MLRRRGVVVGRELLSRRILSRREVYTEAPPQDYAAVTRYLAQMGETPDLVALATGLTTGAIIGPTAAGFVFDRTGSFAPIYMAASVLLVAALLMTLLVNHDAAERATQRHGGEAEGFAPGLQ